MKTISEIKKDFFKKLPQNEIDLIISFVLKKDRVFVITYPEYKTKKNQYLKIASLIKKRINNYPIAYILGKKEFYGYEFLVNESVLVPRPETELMVEEAIKYATEDTKQKTIIDLGTGSGCIIISLAKELKNKHDYLGIDISPKALLIAKKNAKLNKVDKQISFIESNLLSAYISKIKNQKSKIVITANLPYLTPSQIKNSPTIIKEPRLALVAGSDGLKLYNKLFKQILEIKKNNPNISFTIICEIDPSQKSSIRKLAKDILGNNYILELKKDLKNHNRLFIIKEKKATDFLWALS